MAPSKTTKARVSGETSPHLQLIHDEASMSVRAEAPPIGKAVDDDQAEARFFLACGIGKPHVRAAITAARANATSIEKELLAIRLIDPKLYYRWLATELGLPYLDHINPDEVVRLPSMDALLQGDGPLRLSRATGQITVIVPQAGQMQSYRARFAARPALRAGLAVASPAAIRQAVWQSGAGDRVRKTTFQLDQDHREASARQVMTGEQGFTLAMVLCLIFAGFLTVPFIVLTVLHAMLSLFFAGGIVLRLTALVWTILRRPSRRPPGTDGARLPVYTVLIALRDEVEMVPAIVSRIAALRWPKSLLDVKYICEADDAPTIAALQAQGLGPESEIVHTPAFGPRTKPKALQYGLQGARGSLVAVYDAEDKPAPGQLLEAWARFRDGDARLGCLQAPLAIANLRSNWLSGLFALEYSGLFRILIPYLARTGMPIPLGGTSNHFRRTALEVVGGWDPHNVTEDADLGMRLYTRGYRTDVLASATIETAPVSLGVWIRQRTRWLKGWAQTWLVAMRRPVHTCRQLGPCGFIVFQLLIAGMLVSALAHPLMFVFIGLTVAWLATGATSSLSNIHGALLWIDISNISGSYLAFIAMGWRGFTAHERSQMNKGWLLLAPAYWVLMSLAGWRALMQLMRHAHLWEKTPHYATSGSSAASVTDISIPASELERVKGIEPSS